MWAWQYATINLRPQACTRYQIISARREVKSLCKKGLAVAIKILLCRPSRVVVREFQSKLLEAYCFYISFQKLLAISLASQTSN